MPAPRCFERFLAVFTWGAYSPGASQSPRASSISRPPRSFPPRQRCSRALAWGRGRKDSAAGAMIGGFSRGEHCQTHGRTHGHAGGHGRTHGWAPGTRPRRAARPEPERARVRAEWGRRRCRRPHDGRAAGPGRQRRGEIGGARPQERREMLGRGSGRARTARGREDGGGRRPPRGAGAAAGPTLPARWPRCAPSLRPAAARGRSAALPRSARSRCPVPSGSGAVRACFVGNNGLRVLTRAMRRYHGKGLGRTLRHPPAFLGAETRVPSPPLSSISWGKLTKTVAPKLQGPA